MANQHNLGTDETGRARHSVRAGVGLAKGGARGPTRPALLPVNMIAQRHGDVL